MTEASQLSRYFETVARDLEAAAAGDIARRRRRRPVRIAALVMAGLVLVAGTAVAASSLLGDPAPAPTQAALDAYYPDSDEPLSPLPGHAQIVARHGDDLLYRSLARDGKSTCTAITAIGARGTPEIPGSGCTLDTGDPSWPIGVETVGFEHRRLVFGQAGLPPGGGLYLTGAGSGEVRIPLGVAGFFLWELPWDAAGRLELRDAHGATLSSVRLTPPPTVP